MSYPFNQISTSNPQNIGIPTPVGLQTAARNPTPQDNTYVPGSEWQNSVTRVFYKCVSSTIAGAVWTPFIPNTAGTISTLTGNSGGAVGPDGMGNVNVVGDGTSIDIAGNAGTNTLTASLVGGGVAAQSFPTDVAGPITPTAAGVVNFTGSTSTYTNGAVANTIRTEVQGTDHAVFIGNGANTPASTLAVGNDGEVLIGATGADPAFALLTSSDSSITYVVGANSLDLTVTGGQPTNQFAVTSTSGAGTNPVLPDGTGLLTVLGTAVAASSTPIQSISTAANSLSIQVQRAAASAATDATSQGLASFNSSHFSVDGSGFVSLTGGGIALDSIGVQATSGGGTNPVTPTGAGLITINGAAVAAQTIPIQSRSTAANSLQIEVQRASTSATTNATQQGLASFNSGQFVTDASGWISLGPTATPTAWSPNLQFGGANVGITYSQQAGYYVRIGRVVHIGFNITLTSKGVSVGAATFSNLPVTVTASTPAVYLGVWGGSLACSAGYTFPQTAVTVGTTVLQFTQYHPTLGNGTITDTNFTNTTVVYGSIWYFSD